jgi:hypothetical protein
MVMIYGLKGVLPIFLSGNTMMENTSSVPYETLNQAAISYQIQGCSLAFYRPPDTKGATRYAAAKTRLQRCNRC